MVMVDCYRDRQTDEHKWNYGGKKDIQPSSLLSHSPPCSLLNQHQHPTGPTLMAMEVIDRLAPTLETEGGPTRIEIAETEIGLMIGGPGQMMRLLLPATSRFGRSRLCRRYRYRIEQGEASPDAQRLCAAITQSAYG